MSLFFLSQTHLESPNLLRCSLATATPTWLTADHRCMWSNLLHFPPIAVSPVNPSLSVTSLYSTSCRSEAAQNTQLHTHKKGVIYFFFSGLKNKSDLMEFWKTSLLLCKPLWLCFWAIYLLFLWCLYIVQCVKGSPLIFFLFAEITHRNKFQCSVWLYLHHKKLFKTFVSKIGILHRQHPLLWTFLESFMNFHLEWALQIRCIWEWRGS